MSNLSVAEQRLVGRITGGNVAALTAAQVRTLLGLVIGTDVQAYDADLGALGGITSAANTVPVFTGSGTASGIALSEETVLGRITGGSVAAVNPSSIAQAINTQTASYTAVIGDAGKVIEMNVASANNFTVPQNSSVAFPTGTRLDVVQYGAGATTIVADTNVTIRYHSTLTLVLGGQYAGCSLYKRGTNEWVLVGDLTAA